VELLSVKVWEPYRYYLAEAFNRYSRSIYRLTIEDVSTVVLHRLTSNSGSLTQPGHPSAFMLTARQLSDVAVVTTDHVQTIKAVIFNRTGRTDHAN